MVHIIITQISNLIFNNTKYYVSNYKSYRHSLRNGVVSELTGVLSMMTI